MTACHQTYVQHVLCDVRDTCHRKSCSGMYELKRVLCDLTFVISNVIVWIAMKPLVCLGRPLAMKATLQGTWKLHMSSVMLLFTEAQILPNMVKCLQRAHRDLSCRLN